jgi:diguanylate cyclase (GGDEF)-like protein
MRQLFLHLYLHGTSGASESQRARIQIGNLMAATGCIVTLLFGLGHLALGHPEAFALNTVTGLAYLTYFPLQAHGRRNLGCRLIAAMFLVHITILALMFGRGIGMHLYFVLGGPVALVLFASDHRLERVSMVAASLLLYAAIEIADVPPWLAFEPDWGHRVLSLATVPTVVLVLLLIHGVFLAEIHKREAILEQAAQTDALTGLPNRRHGFQHASSTFARALRTGETMAVLMLDLDHFKRVNDRHGHAGGDALLITVARSLEQRLRSHDMLARWGGEEFLVVASTSTPDDAHALAQALLEQIDTLEAKHQGVRISCTASLGVAVLSPQDTTLDALLARADRALYAAKERGRNRVVVDASPAPPRVLTRDQRERVTDSA